MIIVITIIFLKLFIYYHDNLFIVFVYYISFGYTRITYVDLSK